MNWRWVVLLAGLALAGCSSSADVIGRVADESFTGKATGSGEGTGTIEMQNNAGTRCIGTFVSRGSTGGNGFLNCSDGRRAQIQFSSLGFAKGYGFGVTEDGKAVRFTYGLSPDAGAQYIDVAAQPGQVPGAPASGSSKRSTGTGFFVTRQGNILTNAHVVDGCSTITIQQRGAEAVPASIVVADKQNDLALLRTDSRPAAIAGLRGDRPVRRGESVVAYGFPLNGTVSSGGVLTSGTVSALAGLRDDTRYLQISAPLRPGNSGGPLMDATGAVIGVNSLTYVGDRRATGPVPQNVNFAIKADVVRTFLSTNRISAETASGRELSMPDIGERARGFTVLVECKG